jgi:hypothetical protein
MTQPDQNVAVLEEATRKLVEGRAWPAASDRSDRFWPKAGQWIVYLTHEEHERYRLALDEGNE